MKGAHPKLRLLDGSHPFKQAVPGAYVDYAVRRRPGGRIFLFNFELAREIGLLPRNHPDTLDRRLAQELLDCFGLEIVNEYDQLHGNVPATDDGRRYMATRYLQLQHSDRKGLGSGDGRSIWNGRLRGEYGTWDISSCGTGATRLSPATAATQRFYRTGDKSVSYGCGRSDLWEAVCAALMSEVLHHNDVRTERTLAIIRYPDGSAVTVRAYRNLLRPAHLFYHLKQADLEGLGRAVDYYIERQAENGDWPRRLREPRARYAHLLERVTEDFARAVAQFESEYIFCWMDWDGDNILMDGGIIDYGSVRQFGLFHHEYRYDDVDRLSTKLTEQKAKARYIVQTFAQLVDFLVTGRKKNLRSFRNHPALGRFDQRVVSWMGRFMVYKIGFDPALHEALFEDARFVQQLAVFRRVYAGFERAKARRGLHKVSDGVTHDAVFCLRDLLRELPARYLQHDDCLPPERFIELMRSSYASQRDLRLSESRKENILIFQASYRRMIERAAVIAHQPRVELLKEVVHRSALINRRERITGDGILVAARRLVRDANIVNHKELYGVFRDFVRDQILRPERRLVPVSAGVRSRPSRLLYNSLRDIINEYREGL